MHTPDRHSAVAVLPGRVEQTTSVYEPVSEHTCCVLLSLHWLVPGKHAGDLQRAVPAATSHTCVMQLPSMLSPLFVHFHCSVGSAVFWQTCTDLPSVLQR